MNYIYIAIILLILSIIGVYIYTYVVPWTKGTFVSDTCPAGWCKPGSYCCRDPREGSGSCWVKDCKNMRLVQPTEDHIKFFNRFTIITVFVIMILLIIYHKNSNN